MLIRSNEHSILTLEKELWNICEAFEQLRARPKDHAKS